MDDDDSFWTSTRHWTHFDADQSLARVDPATGTMTVLRGGPRWRSGSGSWRPLIDPDERREMGIAEDDTAFYLRGTGRESFDLLIDRIEELRAKTDPADGEASARGKDIAAFQALQYARRLVNALVGWAIAHQVGLAAEGLAFVPLGPGGAFRDLPEHRDAKADVDDHRHELAGDKIIRGTSQLPGGPFETDASLARQAAINLLHANPGAMPDQLARELHDALLALDMNDVRPIFRPSTAYRKTTFAEERLQLEAVCFAHFRAASGYMSLNRAHEEVAEAFEVEVETLKSWEKRLREPQSLGHLTVSRAIQFAKNFGSQVKASAAEIGRISARVEMTGHQTYGDAKLADAALRYKAARADRGRR